MGREAGSPVKTRKKLTKKPRRREKEKKPGKKEASERGDPGRRIRGED